MFSTNRVESNFNRRRKKKMKKFTKMMLSAYPRMPHLLKSMDEVIEESAVRSFYDRSAGVKQAEKLLYRLNKRDSLARIYDYLDSGLEKLCGAERQVLSDRLTGKCRAYDKERYSFSRTTYYRKLRKAIRKMEVFLYENDVENIFLGARLDRTAYFRFLEDALNVASEKAKLVVEDNKTGKKVRARKTKDAFSGKVPEVKWKLTPLALIDAGRR